MLDNFDPPSILPRPGAPRRGQAPRHNSSPKNAVFDPDLEVSALRLWGLNLQQLRKMRDFAYAHGWRPA